MPVHFSMPEIGKNRFERKNVAMDICEDRNSHHDSVSCHCPRTLRSHARAYAASPSTAQKGRTWPQTCPRSVVCLQARRWRSFVPIFGVTPAATSEDQAQTSARLGGNVETDLESFARRQRQEQRCSHSTAGLSSGRAPRHNGSPSCRRDLAALGSAMTAASLRSPEPARVKAEATRPLPHRRQDPASRRDRRRPTRHCTFS